ncbi:metallophosphoesterase family protein [uncultured Methylovirgula sp.]|uniref:metallophosphoesterase family protein n=1 Tax=uncultured Methylovirgula sp. TaxID=1285960 RepID=UPI00262B99F8|nr:metallophosphoesterase family protein [uncultured Methylovirgula sp.]
MTAFALFADIHGNREALDACLADAKNRGADRLVFLGDLVGYGADPAYVVDVIAEKQNAGAIVILGNHDAAVLSGCDNMNDIARASIDWTRRRLDKGRQSFLAALPLTSASGDALFVHADAAEPKRWTYVTSSIEAQRSMRATTNRLVFCGHVHRPQLYHTGAYGLPSAAVPAAGVPISLAGHAKWLAVLGSVGQPRDENPAAAYALYDDGADRLTFVRVAYNVAEAARKIRAAGLPDILASRLFVGR